jgi:hypothetical protein
MSTDFLFKRRNRSGTDYDLQSSYEVPLSELELGTQVKAPIQRISLLDETSASMSTNGPGMIRENNELIILVASVNPDLLKHFLLLCTHHNFYHIPHVFFTTFY